MAIEIQPFSAIGFDFVDHADLDEQQRLESAGLLEILLVMGWAAERPDARMLCCEDEAVQAEIGRRYEAALVSDPDLTFEQFNRQGGGAVDVLCRDQRLEIIRLAALEQNRVVGFYGLQNVEVIGDENGTTLLRALPLPAFPETGDPQPIKWGEMAAYLLQNDLATQAGGRVALAEIRFPDRPDCKLHPDDAPGMGSMWQQLAQHGLEVARDQGARYPSIVRAKRFPAAGRAIEVDSLWL